MSQTKRIDDVVLEFCRLIQSGSWWCFTADDLRKYVGRKMEVAPASPDRILRLLRKQGKVAYTVMNRRTSLYRINAVSA